MNWREYVPFEEGLALILAGITIVLPLHVYLDHPDLFDEYRIIAVLLVAALGGAASFALYIGSGERLPAVVAGLVAGLGAAVLCAAYVRVSLPMGGWTRHLGFYPMLGVGAAPGFLLLWLIRRAAYRRNQR